ncbi:MAG: hypothetical protein BWK77_01900 [Verrucomicrobia bacterium A1]|nr:MAG: hypothetical protein BWK77_01900 [Verrucomicrobia bacterium A1]
MAAKQWTTPPAMTIDTAKTYRATVETNRGTIAIAFEPKHAPKTVNNFVFLAREGFFGAVTEGKDVVMAIRQGDTMKSVTISES